MKKKIALIQMEAALADIEYNYRHAEELMEQAMEGNPDILVLPETWNTGFYISHKMKEIADKEGKQTEGCLSSFSKKHHVNVVGGSAAVLFGNDVYNRSFIFDREGNKVDTYDKVHGFSYAHEPLYFKGGDHVASFKLDGISCSMVICYDIRFPELVRRSVLEGKADLFFIPAAWPKARLFHWTLLGQARAVENQIYLCAVNQGGVSGETEYGGNSALLDPWGNDVCRLGTEEGIAFGEVDTDILQQIRDTIHVFRDRRPEIDVVR